ncbi:MAG: Flp pilus assembly complex ATPase component TadA [Deltaproteobacteria bacterium]|nr:Flp pilus assembly complex ATPase component TadA [Deltaproteobacteria bacterium]
MHYSLKDVTAFLQQAAKDGASEIHFKAPNRPRFRQDGVLVPIEAAALTPAQTHQIAQVLCTMAGIEIALGTVQDHEFGLGLAGIGRFRVQLYRQRGSIGIVLHRMSLQVLEMSALGVPSSFEAVIDHPGLTLIGGGVKRTALMAALVQRFNARLRGHVVVLENPLTVLHRDAMGSIAQRDVGVDVESFSAGVYAAVRQQADLIAVGDVPDTATVEAVITAAENGIGVVACVPSVGVDDIVDHFLKHLHPDYRPGMERRIERVLRGAAYVPDDGQVRTELLFVTAPGAEAQVVLPRAAALAKLKAST